jgi:NAD(P) transhydrogenase subunit alpha
LSKPGEVVNHNGVSIIGHHNVPSRLSANASALYSKNLQNLLALIIDAEGNLAINNDDDIIKGIALTRDGAIIHPNFAK